MRTFLRTSVLAMLVLFVVKGVRGQESTFKEDALVTKEAAERYRELFLSFFPEPSSISKMTGEVHADPTNPHAEIAEFEISEAHYNDILAEFRRGTIDRAPILSLWEGGTIVIIDKSKATNRLSWYIGAKGAPLFFSFNGIRFKTDGKSADGTPIRGNSRLLELLKTARGEIK